MSILSEQIVIGENAATNRVDTTATVGLFEVLIEKNDYFADGHRYPDNRAFWRGSGMVATDESGIENISGHALIRK